MNTQITHPRFGLGTIISKDDKMAVVNFTAYGEKRILAHSYSMLKPVTDVAAAEAATAALLKKDAGKARKQSRNHYEANRPDPATTSFMAEIIRITEKAVLVKGILNLVGEKWIPKSAIISSPALATDVAGNFEVKSFIFNS